MGLTWSTTTRWSSFWLTALVSFFMIAWALRRATGATRWGLLALLAGMVGNGIDRVFRGGVVDFLRLNPTGNRSWITMNLADLYLLFGAVLLSILLIRNAVRNALQARRSDL